MLRGRQIRRHFSIILLCLNSCILLFILQSCLYTKLNLNKYTTASTPHGISIDSFSFILVDKMSLREKVQQMTGESYLPGLLKLGTNFVLLKRFPHIYSGANKRLAIPPFCFSDGPRGAAVEGHQNTVFPVAMARGASWNTALEATVATAMAKEIRASGCNYTGNPCINLLRHPAWGRAQETYGEDPWLLAAFGLHFVRSVQQHQVMSCPKHFALNSIENSRFYVDIRSSERSLREVYLPHFKKVIQEGKAASIMSAYNQFRGEYCGQNAYLLHQILRKEWHFDGFVSTDWVWGLHNSKKGIEAGLDVEMPVKNKYRLATIKKLLKQSLININRIDTMVARIVKKKLQFSVLQDTMIYNKALKGHPKHIELAQRVAEESMVLLKNNNLLPFDLQKNTKVAVIGSLSNQKITGDHGSSSLRNPDIITAFEGIQSFCKKKGAICSMSTFKNKKKAQKLATDCDLLVLYVGFKPSDEGEYLLKSTGANKERSATKQNQSVGGDRLSLQLKDQDIDMIRSLSLLQKNTLVVYAGGSAILMNNWEASVPAILFSWYSGMRGGNALANIIFGAVNPSGKLPFTIMQKEADYPSFDSRSKRVEYGYYHGYTLADKKQLKPAYPFGFGLHYSEIVFDSFRIESSTINLQDSLNINVFVRNKTAVSGAQVCQAYVGFKHSTVDRPIKLLRAFKKVKLAAFEQKKIHLTIHPKNLAYYNDVNKKWEIERMSYELYIGHSSAFEDLLQDSFQIICPK